ncbi:MAG TPA: hydroxymethylglutaryl-CoA reductase [Patescibacteria group bacterium]|nr:hydroxymethylglutaryl-CoA reductase [Patescibacteria group bacterium]
MNIRMLKSAKERRTALEKLLHVELSSIGSFSLDEQTASTRNCENMIGAAQIPMGVAGPLLIKAQISNPNVQKEKEYYIPLATTEGALVASINRGCKAITQSGGAVVDSHRIGATRGPVFRVKNLAENRTLRTFLDTRFDELKEVAAQTSHHLALTSFTSTGIGRYRYIRFVFDTQDAMGLNMVTIATEAVASYIREQTGIECLALSGNYCVDKKPSWLNILGKRGIKVWAEVVLTKTVLRETLKTTARQVYDVWLAKCMLGSVMSGSMAFNAQFANVVAALFAATGQDIAHVVEGSLGVTTAEVLPGGALYMCVYVPDLMIGTVGGGTGLGTQREALSMLGVAGSSPQGDGGTNARHFAEIVGAAVLAGEISLLASLEEGTLAKAHQSLARGNQ